MPYYAKIGVAYAWLIDLEARAVTAQRLESGHWVTLGTYGEDTEVRIEPRFGKAQGRCLCAG